MITNLDFDQNVNVSVFETNIRGACQGVSWMFLPSSYLFVANSNAMFCQRRIVVLIELSL